MASIQFDGTEILSSAYLTQFVKHETVADRSIITTPLAREDGDILITERYGRKIIRLQGTLIAADQATLDANIDSFKELFSRPEKNLDVSWGAGTMRFVATCTAHTFDRDHYHTSAVPWTAEFTVSSGVGKDTATTTALNAVSITTDRPAVMTRSTGASTAVDVTSHAITMPSGIIPGDLLIITFSVDGIPTCSISDTSWTKLGQTSDGTNAVTQAIFWKISTTGSDTATVTTSASEQSTHVVLRIAGGGTPTGTATSGNSTNSDPPSHSISVALDQQYLWVATRGGDAQVVATVAPSSYSNLQTSAAAGASGASTNTAERLITAATSENPGTFTSATEQWVAYTIGVPPRTTGIFDVDQQFTILGSKAAKPVITLTMSTVDALMHGIELTNEDTGERMIITRSDTWNAGDSVVIDFDQKKVTDNLAAGGAQVEGKFYGVFPTLQIGANNFRIRTGGILNQATSDYLDQAPPSAFTAIAMSTTNIYFGTAFQVPYADATFSGVTLGLSRIGTGGGGNFFWRIVGDLAGVPDYAGATIASGTYTAANVPAYTLGAYTYLSAGAIFSLSPNTVYWLVGGMSGGSPDISNHLRAYAASAPTLTYARSQTNANSSNAGSTWSPDSSIYSFRLHMGGDPKVTVATITVAYTKTYL
ncbi:hypothetical protein ACVWZV_002206 [Bradyrhizobium sp. GM5.1]